MPSLQRGTVVKRGVGKWGARWCDETGKRRYQGGFDTKTAAREFLDEKVDEIAALRRGDVRALRRREMPTLGQLVEEFIRQHSAEESSINALRTRLRYALDGAKLDGKSGWRDIRIDHLQPAEIGAWRNRLPARSAFGIVKALRQALHYAVRAKLIDENPASQVANPEPKRSEVPTFTIDELEALADELPAAQRAIPIFAALTGLRPCEWSALERRDVDRKAGTVTIRRTVVDGKVKLYGKTNRSLRTLPMPLRAAEALAEHPSRLDTQILFPAKRGGPIELHKWRWEDWQPAFVAAGIPKRVPYAMRHTYASLSIAAGVSLFELSRFMGTSVMQIEKTYGHLLPDAIDRTRLALDSFLAAQCQISAKTSETEAI